MFKSNRARVLGAVLGFSMVVSASAKEAPKAAFSAKMLKLAQVVSQTLVDTSSAGKFMDPKNAKRIEDNTKKLSELAHDIHKASVGASTDVISPDGDVSVSLIAGLFQDDAKRAYDEFKRGNKEYARTVLRSIPGYCIGCHTRGNSGPQFIDLGTNAQLKGLTPFEKGEVFAATRQYDKALENFEEVFKKESSARDRQIEWEKAARYAVAIAVRVKKDPAQALNFVEKIIDFKGAPQFFKEDANAWKASLLTWKKEMSTVPTSEEGYFAEAQRLMSQAMQSQMYLADRNGDVYYLRATQTLHDLLRLYPNGSKTSESLYLLGLAYRALQGLNLWNLSDLYFEACIRKAPHTGVSSQCYRQYEESIFMGYSGSGGVSIPSDVRTKLFTLEGLAEGPTGVKPE